MAVRYGLDPAPYRQAIQKLWGENAVPMMRLAELVRAGQIPAASEQLKKLRLELRPHACVLGVVALGSRAPSQWRDIARFMLFASERPFFR